MNVFKVTTLRNIERTYPYFHDGSIWDLEEAVKIIADVQIGIELNKADLKAIKAFLISLTGKIPEDALKLPDLNLLLIQGKPLPDIVIKFRDSVFPPVNIIHH